MANPLTLIMPVIPGTSASTIVAALQANQANINAALTSIGTVHFARFLVLDTSTPNLQPGANSQDSLALAIVTEYDGDFDIYIQDFVAQIGDVFNALLPFVIGGSALVPVASNASAFTAFIQQNDAPQHVPNTTLYIAYSYTVQQILAAGG